MSIAHALYTKGDFQAATDKYRDLVAYAEVKSPCKAVAQYEVWRLSLGDPERAKVAYEALVKGWPDSVLTRATTEARQERRRRWRRKRTPHGVGLTGGVGC
jgi:hypothetical protein